MLHGRITNLSGAAIPGATVAAITPSGRVRFSITDEEGRYAVNGLGPGKYVVWACAKDYALYDNSNVDVESWAERNLDIQLLPAWLMAGPKAKAQRLHYYVRYRRVWHD